MIPYSVACQSVSVYLSCECLCKNDYTHRGSVRIADSRGHETRCFRWASWFPYCRGKGSEGHLVHCKDCIAGDVLFRRVLNNHCHLLHSLLPDKRTVMVTSCDVGAMIAFSHTMMIRATLFTDKFINTKQSESKRSLDEVAGRSLYALNIIWKIKIIQLLEIYSFAVTCWQGVFTLVLRLWNCGCSRVFACVFMMRLYGIILLQAL